MGCNAPTQRRWGGRIVQFRCLMLAKIHRVITNLIETELPTTLVHYYRLIFRVMIATRFKEISADEE